MKKNREPKRQFSWMLLCLFGARLICVNPGVTEAAPIPTTSDAESVAGPDLADTNAQLDAFMAFLRHRRQLSEHKHQVLHEQARKGRNGKHEEEHPKSGGRLSHAWSRTWEVLKELFHRMVERVKSGVSLARHAWTLTCEDAAAADHTTYAGAFSKRNATVHIRRSTPADGLKKKTAEHVATFTEKASAVSAALNVRWNNSGAESPRRPQAQVQQESGHEITEKSAERTEKKTSAKNRRKQDRDYHGKRRRSYTKKRGGDPNCADASTGATSGKAGSDPAFRKSTRQDAELQKTAQPQADGGRTNGRADAVKQAFSTGVLRSDEHGRRERVGTEESTEQTQAQYDEETTYG